MHASWSTGGGLCLAVEARVPQANLRYREREYDIAMRYQRDMNFTMVRDWVGQTADEEGFGAGGRGVRSGDVFPIANPLMVPIR